MTVDVIYPGVTDVAQLKPFQFCPGLPNSTNVLLFAFNDCDNDFATICKLFEKRFGKTSSLEAYREIPKQEPAVIQAVFTNTEEIKKILKEASEKRYITMGSTESGKLVQATVYCPISNKDYYTIVTFQDLPLDTPENIKKNVMGAVGARFSRVNAYYYIVDILLDTAFGQGDIALSKYYNGKMSLITQNGYLDSMGPVLNLYEQKISCSKRAKHHLYCSFCKALDFHDTVCCPKKC